MAREGEVGNVPGGGVRNFEQDSEGGTANISLELEPTKSVYLTFDPCGISTIKKSPTGGK